MDITLFSTLGTAFLIAGAGGMLGSFALLRRMALVGDALSHVALPGIALGLLFHFNLFWGAILFLLLGITIIWAVEHKTKLPVDTLVGVMFVLALSVGAILTPQEHLEEALFGNLAQISPGDAFLAGTFAMSMIALLLAFSKKFTLLMISSEIARAVGLFPRKLEFLFLVIFACIVAIGIKFTGVLLMGSLVIIPAAIARNIARTMRGYITLSSLLGAGGAVVGVLVSSVYDIAPGPTFVLLLGSVFFISVLLRK